MFCANCGIQLEAGTRFCTNCGSQIAAGQTEAPSEQEAEKVVFSRDKIAFRLDDNPQYEAGGILTITTKRIHFSAGVVMETAHDDYKQQIVDLSIPFSEIISIVKTRSILDATVCTKFKLKLKNNAILGWQNDTPIKWTILTVKGSDELQKILEQQ